VVNPRKIVRGELPPGVADLFFAAAEQKLSLEATLRDQFALWGYRPLIPPMFEYAETLASEAGVRLAEEMYRFFDRDGRSLALRPDLTIPTARIVGGKLFDQPLPLRFFYIGSVFRYAEPRAGQRREFTQAGVELIGAPGSAADSEVIALLAEALGAARLPAFRITLGQVGFFRGLLTALDLTDLAAERLRLAIDRKSQVSVTEILASLKDDAHARQAVAALPSLTGGPEVLDAAAALILNDEMAAAVENLRQVCTRLERYGIMDRVTLDLGQARGMAYYTGILFEAFAPGVGFPLASGGRYDGLIGHFGPNHPAVGFALTVDRLLAALGHQTAARAQPFVDAVFQMCEHTECLRLVQQARSCGANVSVDLLGRSPDALMAYAHSQEISRVLLCAGPGQVRLLAAGVERDIDAARWEDEVRSWIG
jgi:ATP phosphoribosyltransferase regulatory subunit